jgi:hypothetical protein
MLRVAHKHQLDCVLKYGSEWLRGVPLSGSNTDLLRAAHLSNLFLPPVVRAALNGSNSAGAALPLAACPCHCICMCRHL